MRSRASDLSRTPRIFKQSRQEKTVLFPGWEKDSYMAKRCDLLIGYTVLQNSNSGRIMRKVRPGCTVVNLAKKASAL